MKICFVSDFFKDEYHGGAEAYDDEIINLLKKNGHDVIKKKSNLITNKECECENLIFSNFVNLTEEIKNKVIKLKNYIIIEHDHKYIKSRDPANYEFFLAPIEDIINLEFYKKNIYFII